MAAHLMPSPSPPPQKKKEREDTPALSANIPPPNPSYSGPRTHPRGPTVAHIDEKINQLKKKKEKIQMQQALLFIKEAQNIFQEDFSPDRALTFLSEAWQATSESQKEELRKRNHPFRSLPLHHHRKKTPTFDPTPHTS